MMADRPPEDTQILGERRKQMATQLGAAYGAGRSVRELAAETGRSAAWVRGMIAESDVALRAYEAGQTVRELAADTGCSYGWVHRLLVASAVAFRARGGAGRRASGVGVDRDTAGTARGQGGVPADTGPSTSDSQPEPATVPRLAGRAALVDGGTS
jgi:Helix-turn-helix domain